MSSNGRPRAESPDTPPALTDSMFGVPVTPSISNEDKAPSYHHTHLPSELPPHILEAVGARGAPEYGNGVDANGPTTGEELLRQLSLTQKADPRADHSDLDLSGNVISVAFCLPYKVGYAPDGDWEFSSRRGTSALFDSFAYLSEDASHWNHTLVGWTGEIDRVGSPKGPHAKANVAKSSEIKPLSKASAPIPIHGAEKPPPASELVELRIALGERRRLEAKLERAHGGHVKPVWLADSIDDNDVATFKDQQRWRRYSEHELFTLFHYKQNEPNDGRDLRKTWADYYRMNEAFAEAIMEIYNPGDIILIHDYHLLLLPGMLRARMPSIYVGFFLHVPFPSSEYYRCLTRRKEILEGVLSANMIGFQAYSYARHFSSCSTRILGFESSAAGVNAYGAHVPVEVFPIGIDTEAAKRAAFESPEVEEKIASLRELYAGKKIIVGRDRLDSVRGVAQKLQAFELFLERYPEWHDQVVLIQVTSPTSIEEYEDKGDKTANKIAELVAKINGAYGSLSFTPVQHYPQYLAQEEYFALLRVADVGLITSVRDGMNTTALEYVVAQRDTHSPLIISEFSGTAGSLGDAIHINPWDLGSTADEIHNALTMSEPRKEEIQKKLFDHVSRNNVQDWTDGYIRRLLTNLTSHDQSIATPPLDRVKCLSQYRKASRRLFMFDYDGTLTPIVKDPGAAIPSDRVIRTLKTLAADPNNQVWIISGRDQEFLDEWMGHISELGLSAEHGSFMRMPNSTEWENLTETFDMGWQDEVLNVFNHYTERTQGSFVERKKIALTWHYRRADPEYGAFMARECHKYLDNTVAKYHDVEVMTGKANLEVRPRFVNKGEIAKRLVREYGERPGDAPDFVLCLGDDATDEDMFRTLRQSDLPEEHRFAVTVGAKTKQTLATWHLLEPPDVISVIAMLNGTPDASNVGAVAVVDGAVPDARV